MHDRVTPNLQQAETVAGRIVALDRARTFITLSVVLYHSAINYTYFGQGGDRMHWLGFDLIALFNDSYFMSCMFFISGLFVPASLARRGPSDYVGRRALRLGVPYIVSIFVIMPIAYYRYYVAEDHFTTVWWRMISEGPWPSGSAWFLGVLLAFDAAAALSWAMAPQLIGRLGRWPAALLRRPLLGFAVFLLVANAAYLPPHLWFGDGVWFMPGHFPLPLQASRSLLYPVFFMAGVAMGAAGLTTGPFAAQGALVQRWPVWFGLSYGCYGLILFLAYAHHNWIADFDSPPLWWRAAYGMAVASFCASMAFAVPTLFLRWRSVPLALMDRMQPSAYGIYLLHFLPLLWLQYLVYVPAWPAAVKFAIVLVGTLSVSWLAAALLRRLPLVARVI
ncbi:acyltransferase family protein [Bradyrhizobium sp.]|uniref:Acyltransferase family protein n=2 Tax=Nitrobacteraceae TaxID=41294 RepID=A0ABS5G4S0_9BRAD|nr:acyltransferase family protein [Bradyrhizobium sp.]MBR1136317.1 acyltransferase family protein [Bradyrhizobium denitrificans]NPU22492.1 acyltransferase family protein [Bradyrhizobium sp. LMG 8443]MDU1492760.1 acyltransferase family protein [Bradyrhizobium sp.]MDU1543116.1 acyltransferase family protein [Bradyrhizobium sp.]MDU1688963.1 acyltransferase family protein [Bradyrhizobium sp.]